MPSTLGVGFCRVVDLLLQLETRFPGAGLSNSEKDKRKEGGPRRATTEEALRPETMVPRANLTQSLVL